MNRAGREIFVAGEQIESRSVNVLRRNLVRNVDDLRVRIDGEDHTLHRPGEIILGAEVG